MGRARSAAGRRDLKTGVVKLAGIDIELFEAGAGAALLWLHGANGFDPAHPFVKPFAERRRLVAPSHPGFGKSGLPDWLDRPDDIAVLYLELLDQLGLARAEIVGCSLGGWIAAEMAALAPERVTKLVLVGPAGVKVGPGDKLDIPDIWAIPQEEVNKLLFHDPAKMAMDPTKFSDEQLSILLRNRETTALLTWEPWMHNPKLEHRLHRVKAPTLFVRGVSDGLMSASYVEGYAKLVPGARIATIAAAGHAPQIEQPAAFAAAVFPFLDG
jgi:pimeloyl-ACP methyl ester carboxylesterase